MLFEHSGEFEIIPVFPEQRMPGGWAGHNGCHIFPENKFLVKGPVKNENKLMLRVGFYQPAEDFLQKMPVTLQVIT